MLAKLSPVVLGLLAVTAAIALRVAGPQAVEPANGVNVLFIGNSFTYYHDLPQMVAELAKTGLQRPLVHHSETPGGCTLEKHWQDGQALALIKSRRWDYVVLQDQSQMPLLARESMFSCGAKFDAAIKEQNAQTILYMTWATGCVFYATIYRASPEGLSGRIGGLSGDARPLQRIAWEAVQGVGK